jgi:hypothetical protein
MNVRLSPETFNVAGERAFFVEGHTGDSWMEWLLVSAPLTEQGRPDMTKVTTVTLDFDWTGTPFEGTEVHDADILNLIFWIGNVQRAHKCLPGVWQ